MNTILSEDKWEKKLNIETLPAKHEKDDSHHSRYEPTPYCVLERLCGSGLIHENDLFIDYGCGKGRVGFFMSHTAGLSALGVEYNPSLYQAAKENLQKYAGRRERIEFICESAENYVVQNATCFYFFNPFSIKILKAVLSRIYDSYYENPRKMRLFFYYALDSYLTELISDKNLRYEGEIDCRDLFHNADEREKILIFSVIS
ncbi:MAG: class I SAM-dependent methyltransferase [Clostridia bacterium]|nr:class I SAM-dependent methyltransferase [Clostridia bacterium]